MFFNQVACYSFRNIDFAYFQDDKLLVLFKRKMADFNVTCGRLSLVIPFPYYKAHFIVLFFSYVEQCTRALPSNEPDFQMQNVQNNNHKLSSMQMLSIFCFY